jgi:hypothetical protein
VTETAEKKKASEARRLRGNATAERAETAEHAVARRPALPPDHALGKIGENTSRSPAQLAFSPIFPSAPAAKRRRATALSLSLGVSEAAWFSVISARSEITSV